MLSQTPSHTWGLRQHNGHLCLHFSSGYKYSVALHRNHAGGAHKNVSWLLKINNSLAKVTVGQNLIRSNTFDMIQALDNVIWKCRSLLFLTLIDCFIAICMLHFGFYIYSFKFFCAGEWMHNKCLIPGHIIVNKAK